MTGQFGTDTVWTLNTRNWEDAARKGLAVLNLLHLWVLITGCCVEDEMWGKMGLQCQDDSCVPFAFPGPQLVLLCRISMFLA